MKFKVKANVFESAQCTFDGSIAVSYGWYIFARRMADNTWLFTSHRYSMQTGRHINEVRGLLYGETINYVDAPGGLDHPESVRNEVMYSIRDMEAQLANKRNRNLEWRRSRLERLQAQLLLIDKWQNEIEVQDV